MLYLKIKTNYNIDMKKENRCYTYFHVGGDDFPIDEISKALNETPFRSWYRTDIRKADGKEFGFCNWSGFRVDEYSPYTEEQMEKTIEPLLDKIDVLNELREKYNLKYSLIVVPHIIVNKINPDLSPSMKVIDFCHAIRAEISIDLYLYK